MSELFIQAHSAMRIKTPLGEDVLLLERLVGEERVSAPFRFHLDLVSEDPEIDATKLLGQTVGVEIDFGAEAPQTRYISGVVAEFVQLSRGRRFTRYRAEVVPWLWLTTLTRRSRVFQEKTVVDIAREVLASGDAKFDVQGTFEPWNYRVQYRETDFQFISRLMEEEGIYYYHVHAAGGHTLVVANSSGQAPDCDGGGRLRAAPGDFAGHALPEPLAYALQRREGVVPAKWSLWDHNFQLPRQSLEAAQAAVDPLPRLASGTEVYDYPGGYAHQFDGIDRGGGEQAGKLQKIFDQNRRTAALLAREGASQQTVLEGESNWPLLTPGHGFALDGHYRGEFNDDYFVVAVRHEAAAEIGEDGGRGAFSYRGGFVAVPKKRPFAPPRVTPPARVDGAQTARVVGPAGAEIFTDKYGRVKVQFPWDREGRNNDASSCWLRVSTPWAGKNWGMIAIPRVGSEVLVDFLEGDPDKPIVTGMVYNADFMPPYALPANMTQSGIKSRSTQNGAAENFNEIRFEDKKGAEEIYLHAEKDLNAVVENNETRKVGFLKKDKGDQAVEVFNNQTLKVGAGEGEAADGSQTVSVYKNQTVTVETGDQAVTLKQGNRTVTLDKGNETIEIKMGNRTVTLDKGNDELTLKMGNLSTKVKMGNVGMEVDMGNHRTQAKLGSIQEEAMQGIEMTVGQNSIVIDQAGVTIKGLTVKVEGTIQTQVKGMMTQVNGDAILQVKGGITMIN